MLDFTISLVTYRPNLEDLEKLFHSLNIQKDVSFEFLVWDNSPYPSNFNTPFQTNYKIGVENVGYGKGHNQNFKRKKPSKYFLVINPDIYFDDPYLLKKIKDRMDAASEIGLSSVRLLNPDGSNQDMHRQLPCLSDIARRFILRKLKMYRPESHKYTLSHIDKTKDFICPSIGGSFMVFRTDMYKILNGFDEGIFLYFEDIDISRRCHQLTQEKNTVFGELTAYHFWGQGGYRSFKIFKAHMLSTAYYFQKYGILNDSYAHRVNER